MFEKDFWEATKVFFDAIRLPIILVAIAIFIIVPGLLQSLAHRAGFKIESVDAGVFKAVAESSTADLDGIAAQLKQVSSALQARDALLQEVADQATNADTKKKIADLIQSGAGLAKSAQQTASAAAQQATVAEIKLQTVAPPPPSKVSIGPSLYVFGADQDVRAALDEVRKAQSLLAGTDATVALFHKGSFYRSVAIFPSDSSRSQAEATIVKGVGRSGQPVSLATWCPGAQRGDDAKSPDGKVTVPVYQC
jgi:hypothetical protein